MNTPLVPKIFAVLLCVVFILPAFAFATDAKLTEIEVSNNRDDLLLFLKVDGAFNKELKEAVLNGIPATFSFFITLEESRTLWPDKTIAKLTVTHELKYNNLKNQFIVKRSCEGNKPVTTESFEDAQKLMSEIKSLKLVSLNKLTKGSTYQVNAKAELDKVELPFFLNYILFFASLWDFETDWAAFEFIY
jgi:uncharacterized protein DUF4390